MRWHSWGITYVENPKIVLYDALRYFGSFRISGYELRRVERAPQQTRIPWQTQHIITERSYSDPYGPRFYRLPEKCLAWCRCASLFGLFVVCLLWGMGCILCYGHCGYDTITILYIIYAPEKGDCGGGRGDGFYVRKQHVVVPF